MTTAPTLNETAALERHTPGGLALPVVTGGTSSALALMTDFTNTVRQVEAFVNALVDTPFVPEAHWPLPVGVKAWEMPNKSARMRHARETQEDWQIRRQIACASGTGAVLTGLPLGLDPLVALAQVFVVKGRPGLYTKIKLALAQARGHDVWDVERSDTRAVVAGRRRGWPQDRFVEITVTIEEAQRAGWTENDTYTKTPADMLWSRAMSRVLDRIAADVLFGIASIEDLEVDDVPEPTSSRTEVQAPAPPAAERDASTARLRAALEGAAAARGHIDDAKAAVRDVREQVDALANEREDGPESPPIEQTDWRRLMARFAQLGVNGPGRDVRRLQVMSAIVGRTIGRGGELSRDEAALILDNLAGEAGARTVAAALGEDRPAQAEPDPDEPRAATQDDVEAEADDLTTDSPEPAADEGRPAALDGVSDPWDEPGVQS